MSPQEKYAEKIAKLLAKAESTTPEEAELLFGKAADLMAAYAIDEAMVDHARGVERDEIVREVVEFEGTYRQALAGICRAAAQNMGCQDVFTDDAATRVYRLALIGFQSDVKRVQMLNASLQIQCARAMAAWWKEFDGAGWMNRNQKFAARREFVFGFTAGARTKLKLAADGARDAATRGNGSGTELVLRSRKERVDEWTDSYYGHLRTVHHNYLRGCAGSNLAGRAAGQRADVGQSGLRGARELTA